MSPSPWGRIPHIQQLRPEGAARGHDGSRDCAPAVVAMLARATGGGGDLSDAALIQQLGQGLVGPEGTMPQDIAPMLERAGLPLAGKALAGRYALEDVARHLQQGHTLIAQVEALADCGTPSAHYVVVTGMTQEGNFLVSDPMAHGPYELTPQQLRAGIRRAPPDGGMLIPVGAPPVAQGHASAPGARDTFEAPTGSALCNKLDIRYGALERRRRNQDVAPDRFTVKEFARRLLLMKQHNPLKAEQLLGRLEISRNRKDQGVLRRIETLHLRQPGIGKKTTGDGFSG